MSSTHRRYTESRCVCVCVYVSYNHSHTARIWCTLHVHSACTCTCIHVFMHILNMPPLLSKPTPFPASLKVHTHVDVNVACSSQGWAPCVLLFRCLFVRFMGWGFLGFLSPPFCLFASVLYTCRYGVWSHYGFGTCVCAGDAQG